jgi:ubiquinone biosynthesis protein
MFTQIFRYGFFHADPHPGNIFILPGNVICMLDFGMVGSVDLRRREIFVDMIDGLARKNVPYVTQALLRLTTWERKPDTDEMAIDITEFMGRHLFKPLKDLDIGKGLQDLLEILACHKLRLPSNIFLMTKAFSTLEGISKKLNPEMDLISHAAPFVTKVKLGRFAPHRIASSIMRTATDLHTFTQEFPNDLLEVTRLLKNDNITLNIKHRGLQPLITKYDQVSNRISFAIIIAGLLLGSALIITARIPPLIFGYSVLGLIGFIVAGILGVWLLVAVLWKGRL